MINSLYHAEIGGGYSNRQKVVINAADLRSIGEGIEVAAIDDRTGEELYSFLADSEADALDIFKAIVLKYAEPFQRAVFAAGLAPGQRYTLVYLGEFGFPIVEKITFQRLELTTYAQHSDVVRMIYKPYRKSSSYSNLFYNSSLLIFDGWQDLPEAATVDIIKDDGAIKMTRSKYGCFDARYIEDAAKLLKNPVLVYKAYKTGVNRKTYG